MFNTYGGIARFAPGFVAVLLTGASFSAIAWAEPADEPKSPVQVQEQREKDEKVEAGDDTELTAVPIVGGDSDVGVGGGFILSYAHLRKGYRPYLYRLEAVGVITFKGGEEGSGVQIPYTDNYALLHLPHVIKDELEVELRLNFTREGTLKFYGLGNASRVRPDLDPNDNYFEHSRAHPGLRWRSTYHVTQTIDLLFGATYTQNWLTVRDDTQLAETMRSGSAVERELLGTPKNHAVAQVSGGMAWDSRDSEVSAKRGQYHSVRTDFSPAIGSALPYTWARVTSAARVFVPLIPEKLTFAARLVGDFLVGDVPFYEFVRYDDMFAIGGGSGLRGVPAQRYCCLLYTSDAADE